MGVAKIGPNHRITIPEDAREALNLAVGDVLEGHVEAGRLVLVPKKRTKTLGAVQLSPQERKILGRARRKIARIRKDLATARGLTPDEAEVAARSGLITPEQGWWWTEDWQHGERRAERDIAAGRTKALGSAEELIADLRGR
jgi:AbrB family looped-hinge helix DNA binding protein